MSTEFVNGLVTALGSLIGVVLVLVPGFVLANTLDRGARAPEPSDLQFTVKTAVGGVIVHVLLSFWTIPLWDGLIRNWRQDGGLDGWDYARLVLWLVVALLAVPMALGALIRLAARSPMPSWATSAVGYVGLDFAARAPDSLKWALERAPIRSRTLSMGSYLPLDRRRVFCHVYLGLSPGKLAGQTRCVLRASLACGAGRSSGAR